MIIDTHCHLWGMQPKSWWDNYVEISAKLAGKSFEEIEKKVPGWADSTGDLLVEDMDEVGIDKAVLLTIDRVFEWGVTRELSTEGEVICWESIHEMYAKATQRHPTRLLAFAGVDPRRPNAAKLLERAINEWGMKGLKMHPASFYFYPNDPMCYKLYEKCAELGLPVLFHTGPEDPPALGKFSLPIHLDEVARDFPELNIIMAHAGNCYWQEAAGIAYVRPNVYLDLAWWQPKILQNPLEQFYRPLRSILDIAGSRRVLFASDWPSLRQARRMNHIPWLKTFREIPDTVREAGIEFSDQEINRILGENATRVLGIKD
ncbi:amidohydrolase family protein [Chloroflexota bacterium]